MGKFSKTYSCLDKKYGYFNLLTNMQFAMTEWVVESTALNLPTWFYHQRRQF